MTARTIHPFPARMAPEIALSAIPSRTADRLTVLDPMCGSGTVLAAASERGHRAIGVDIDPLAVMMSRLTITPVDSSALRETASFVVERARTTPGITPWNDDETSTFVDFWFGPKQRTQLIDLSTAVASIQDETLKLALQLAISRIIVTKSSQASLAQDTSHSRPHRVRTESDYDVLDGFRRSTDRLATMLDRRTLRGFGEVHLGDARALENVPDGSVDIAVTSPPYLNALDYLRGHKLALVWFGYSIAELRARRATSIGADRALEVASAAAIPQILDQALDNVQYRSELKLPMLIRFAHDCISFASQLAAKCRSGGKAVLVVGNSTLRGNYIRNDFIVSETMAMTGFVLEEKTVRPIPSTSRYMAINTQTTDSALDRRMRDEVVLSMRRL